MTLVCTFALAAVLSGPTDAAPADRIAIPYPVNDLTGDDPARLGAVADAVVADVGREAWATFGGPGTIGLSPENGAIVIRQTRANHKKVSEYLTAERLAREAL